MDCTAGGIFRVDMVISLVFSRRNIAYAERLMHLELLRQEIFPVGIANPILADKCDSTNLFSLYHFLGIFSR